MPVARLFPSLGRLKQYLLYRRKRQLTNWEWRERFHKILAANPEYGQACDPLLEREHISRWKPLRSRINVQTLRVCRGISGVASADYVPEEVYTDDIEPRLNRHREANFLSHKSSYDRWFSGSPFVKSHLHNVDGVFFGSDYQTLTRADAYRLVESLDFPVVLKANMGTSGGKDVFFPKSPEEATALMDRRKNYLVQPRMEQDEFFAQFNRAGLNTLRVCLYRSVRTDDIHIMNVSLRMGQGGTLDNETAGGIVCLVGEDGRLNRYAVDKYGTKYFAHPDTHIIFDEVGCLPRFDEMRHLAKRVMQNLFLIRLTSLDMFCDSTGNWRVLEVNLSGQTIRFSQYGGRPFFGRFTDEVVEYCKAFPLQGSS